MDDLQQLEAELMNVNKFLNSRANEREHFSSQWDSADSIINNAHSKETATAIDVDQRAKPKTFSDLLNFLDNAPEGPVELDPSLLYSPRSSTHDDEDILASETWRDGVAISNDNNLFPTASTAPQKQFQRPQRTSQADEIRAFNEKVSLSKMRALQRLEQLRIEQQRTEMAECSFAPHTGRPPTGPRAAQSQLRVEDRLLLAANKRKNDVARRLQQEKDENERIECTFAPHLVAPLEKHLRESHRPIHERLNDEWRRKEAILQQARAKADAEASFRPRINPISVQLAEQRRIRKESENKKKGKEDDAEITENTVIGPNSNKQPDFQVKMNPVSQRMLEISSRVPSDFHRRQLHFLKKREENIESLASDPIGEAKECSFRPDTNGAALAVLALSDTRFDQAIEAPNERWTRMAFREAQLREERLKLKEAEIRAEEATFHPQLNPLSLRLVEEKASRHHMPLSNSNSNNNESNIIGAVGAGGLNFIKERGKEEEQRRRREAIATRDLKECTFFPNTAKPRVIGYYDEYQAPVPTAELSIAAAVKDGGGPDALLQRIEEHRRKKEEWAAHVRAQEERKQLAECTFAPSINNPAGTAASGATASVHESVAGMGRFLEVKAMAERRHAEMEARAAKVFLTQPKGRGGVTVPKPFKLASEARRQATARSGAGT